MDKIIGWILSAVGEAASVEDVLSNIASVFFNWLLTSILEPVVEFFNMAVQNILLYAFHIEDLASMDSSILSAATISSALTVLYTFTVLLLALKLIWKGEQVYVLWLNGEAEVSPTEMIWRAIFALGIAIAFPLLYDYGCSIATAIIDAVLACFTGSNATSELTMAEITAALGVNNLVFSIFVLVYIVMLLILTVQMLMRGVELLIYRLGIPLAVIGLIDSDGGVWKNYIQMFFKQLATVAIQYFCLSLAARLMSASPFGLILGTCVLITAFRMPKLLNSWIVAGSGGGRGGISTIIMAARMFAGGG